ncbi:ABC transporter permease [Desulfovibrio subterraneus]|uniref:ABC transporter permease n=1 Tax=Desulfovibrio subterraneus TaxID=2718620 RepID=UPI002FD49615
MKRRFRLRFLRRWVPYTHHIPTTFHHAAHMKAPLDTAPSSPTDQRSGTAKQPDNQSVQQAGPYTGNHGSNIGSHGSLAHRLRLFWRIRSMALTVLWAYKLRSAFVIAAIALGIASLTVIIAAHDGANRRADEITDNFGPDALLILGADITNRAVGQRSYTLTWNDAQRIRQSLPGTYLVVPMQAQYDVSASYGNNKWGVRSVIGATDNYGESWNWPLAEGRDISATDVEQGARVCLLGDSVAKELFGDTSPVGKSFFLNKIPFTVAGVLTPRGLAGGGGNLDDRIIIPLTTMMQRFGVERRYFRALRIKFVDAERMDDNVINLESLLRHLHGIREGEPNDFTILSAVEVQKFLSMIKGGLTIFLGITAAAAILVGGFVLANLFYLSVSERMREIGLRRALGADRNAIITQFLIEAVALTVIGAVVGIFIGLAMGQMLARLGLIEIHLSWKIFSYALASATAVGLIFGLRPARHAADMDPIQALRGGD